MTRCRDMSSVTRRKRTGPITSAVINNNIDVISRKRVGGEPGLDDAGLGGAMLMIHPAASRASYNEGMPGSRRSGPGSGGVTLTAVARFLRRNVRFMRRVAEAAGVDLRAVVPMRHDCPDTRPRKTGRRNFESLTPIEIRRVLFEHYRRIGARLNRSADKKDRNEAGRGRWGP